MSHLNDLGISFMKIIAIDNVETAQEEWQEDYDRTCRDRCLTGKEDYAYLVNNMQRLSETTNQFIRFWDQHAECIRTSDPFMKLPHMTVEEKTLFLPPRQVFLAWPSLFLTDLSRRFVCEASMFNTIRQCVVCIERHISGLETELGDRIQHAIVHDLLNGKNFRGCHQVYTMFYIKEKFFKKLKVLTLLLDMDLKNVIHVFMRWSKNDTHLCDVCQNCVHPITMMATRLLEVQTMANKTKAFQFLSGVLCQ